MSLSRRRRHLVAAALLLLGVAAGVASTACSAIIGLDPPPDGGSGSEAGAGSDATVTGNDGGDAASSGDGASSDSGAIACASLDAGSGDFSPFAQTTLADGGQTWDFFDTSQVTGSVVSFGSGTFDGRYVYFVGHGQYLERYDTTASFGDVTAWSSVHLTTIAPVNTITGAFLGAVFDGRYVYFVPYGTATAPLGVAARFDTQAPLGTLSDATAWSTFNLATLDPDGLTTGFNGGSFDGRYVYFVPHNDGAPTGKVVRYDTRLPDAGAPKVSDAGDGGDAGDSGAAVNGFTEAAQWTVFDLTTVSSVATGFSGGVFDGTSVYFVPSANGAYDASVDNGNSGIVARYEVDAAFDSGASWSTFDLTKVNGFNADFFGGAFDGHHVYLVPRGYGIATRFETGKAFTTPAAWSTYDLERVATRAASAAPVYSGAAYDGRFVYYVPTTPGFGTATRYDTMSTFTADCAWSTVDLTHLDAGADASAQNFSGAVFDGTYVYFVPQTGGIVARFAARGTPAGKPFTGSFL